MRLEINQEKRDSGIGKFITVDVSVESAKRHQLLA